MLNYFLQLGVTKAVAVQPAMEASPTKKLPTKQRRVVVTGMGVETSLGHDPEVFYNNLLEGVSGISEIEGFDCSQYPTVCLAHVLLLRCPRLVVLILT